MNPQIIEIYIIGFDMDFDFDESNIANRPNKDFEGFVKGKLVSFKMEERAFTKPRFKNDFADDIVQKVFMFNFVKPFYFIYAYFF